LDEIEQAARRLRQEFMGQGLAMVINGCEMGFQLASSACPQCGQAMQFDQAWQA